MGIPVSSKSPTARLLVHTGWHMTAALIIQPCLSVDIPLLLRHGHELQTILGVYTTPLAAQAEPLMQLAGVLPLMRPSLFMMMFWFKPSGLNGVSCIPRGLGLSVFELFASNLSGILINLLNEHQTAYFVRVYLRATSTAIACASN